PPTPLFPSTTLFRSTIVAVAQAREALEHGLTSVGEISRFGIHLRNMIEADIIPGPRIVATGLGFCRTSGHGDSHKLPLEYNDARSEEHTSELQSREN